MESNWSTDLVLSLRRKYTKESTDEEENTAEQQNEEQERKILCVSWKNGKLGAAYYNFSNKVLFVYEELADFGPEFFRTRSLYREVNPQVIITFGKRGDEFIKKLVETVSPSQSDGSTTTNSSEDTTSLPENFHLLTARDYSFQSCKHTISSLAKQDAGELERAFYTNSVINFDHQKSVHATGALLKFLDKNWNFFLSDKEDLTFLNIEQVSMRDNVLMDSTSTKAFQVFQPLYHDAGFKRGACASNYEGLSVYKLFSSNCKSKLGLHALRNILLRPLNNIRELNKRLDFINFVLNPTHADFVESLQDNLKHISELGLIFSKIKNSKGCSGDWQLLYKSIYHTIFMAELSTPYRAQCELLQDFTNSVTDELVALENSIRNAIDFSGNKVSGRPAIKLGVDQHLDAKKLRYQDLAKHITAAAKVAAKELPDFLNECSIVYLPEMGYLVAIKEWESDCDPQELSSLGYSFMFTLRGIIHYKNPLCVELDSSLGDINAEIVEHEIRIIGRLASFVLKFNKDIRAPLDILATMDALISMGKVADRNNYVRPNLNQENVHEIEECRHPLLELASPFEPNDFYSGSPNYSHIKIITGPNGSGKSVYLKQIGLVIYFAHIGSYVPAKRANIGLLHSIHSRMQATESASVRLSGFMIDVIQVSQAIHNSRSNSLILIDEFGRGTTFEDGVGLLAGTLEQFYDLKNLCPHIIVSTHFQKIVDYLPKGSLIECLKMMHSQENDVLSFLFKLQKGIADSSLAIDIAAEIGLDKRVLDRARELLACNEIEPLPMRVAVQNISQNRNGLVEFLSNVEIPDPDD